MYKKKFLIFVGFLLFLCGMSFAKEVKVYSTNFYRYGGKESINLSIFEEQKDSCLRFIDSINSAVFFLYFDEKEELDDIHELAYKLKLKLKSCFTADMYRKDFSAELFKDYFGSWTYKTKIKYEEYGQYGYMKVFHMYTKSKYINDYKNGNLKNDDRELCIWASNDEISGIIRKALSESGKKQALEENLIPYFEGYEDEVLANLDNNMEPMDIFVFEDMQTRKVIETHRDQLLDLTDVYNEFKDNLVPYTVDVGSKDGKVYGLSISSCPGVMVYRKSFAREYFGTDNPEEIQKRFCDWDKFLESAYELKERSNGACKVISSVGDILRPYLSCRTVPLFEDGRVESDSSMIDFMDFCKTLYDNRLNDKDTRQWSSEWFDRMRNSNKKKVFAYFMPDWGLKWILKPNAPETSGDWGVIEGPSPYYWGGNWILASKNARNPEEIKNILRLMLSDEVQKSIVENGNVGSTKKSFESVENENDSFFGNQNLLSVYARVNNKLRANFVDYRESEILDTWMNVVVEYITGKCTKEEAIQKINNSLASGSEGK